MDQQEILPPHFSRVTKHRQAVGTHIEGVEQLFEESSGDAVEPIAQSELTN